jgi:hypothetical protein
VAGRVQLSDAVSQSVVQLVGLCWCVRHRDSHVGFRFDDAGGFISILKKSQFN